MDRPIASPRRRRWVIAVGAVLLVLIISAGAVFLNTERSLRLPVDRLVIVPVEQGTFRHFANYTAEVVPQDLVYIDAQEGGQVTNVRAAAGDLVQEGQVLLEFGNTNLQLQVIERETRLIEQINNLRNVQSVLEAGRVENARTVEEVSYNITRLSRLSVRRDSLAASGATSAEQREMAADELAYYKAILPIVTEGKNHQEELRQIRLPELRDALEKLGQNLTITRSKLDTLVVRAPIAGRLVALDLKVGQHCEPGTRLAEVVAENGFKLSAQIDQFYVSSVSNGQQGSADIDGAHWDVRVERVYPTVKDGYFTIDLMFLTQPEGLLKGQDLRGRVRLGEDQQALILPAGPFLKVSGGAWVFVVEDGGGYATRRNIKIGKRSSEQLEVLHGLKPGEKVVTSSYSGLERVERLILTQS